MRRFVITLALVGGCAPPPQSANQTQLYPYPSEDPANEPAVPTPRAREPVPAAVGQWGFSLDYPGQLVTAESEEDRLRVTVSDSTEHGLGFELAIDRSIDEWDVESAAGQVMGHYGSEGYEIAQYADYDLLGRPGKVIVAIRMPYTSVVLAMARDRCLFRVTMLAMGQTESDDLETALQKALDRISVLADVADPCTEPPSEQQVAAALAAREAAAESQRARRATSDQEIADGFCSEGRFAAIEAALDALEPWLEGSGLYTTLREIVIASPGGTSYQAFVMDGSAFHVFVAASDEVSRLAVTDERGSEFTASSVYAGLISNAMGGTEVISRSLWPDDSGAVTITITGHGCAMLLMTMSND